MKAVQLIAVILLFTYLAHGQGNQPRSVSNDRSTATRLLLDTCTVELNSREPSFKEIPIIIPLGHDDYSDDFNWDSPSVIISRQFIYTSLDSLDIQPTGQPDLGLPQLDLQHYTNEQVETILLTVLCHEFGHFLRKLYNDTLMSTLGRIHPLLQRQQVEYTCDFVSGFMSGKTLWRQIRDRLYKSCGAGDPTQVMGLIKAVDSLTFIPLDAAFNCLEPFVLPYRKTEVLIKYGTDCDHGLGEERKKAFDAGLFFSIYEGIFEERFEDPIVKALLDIYLKIKKETIAQIKQNFADNLTLYLVRRKGMNPDIVPKLMSYSGRELYVAAFSYVMRLKKKTDGCPIELHLQYLPGAAPASPVNPPILLR